MPFFFYYSIRYHIFDFNTVSITLHINSISGTDELQAGFNASMSNNGPTSVPPAPRSTSQSTVAGAISPLPQSPTTTPSQLPEDVESCRLRTYHMTLLRLDASESEPHELITAPMFTMPVLKHAESILSGQAEQVFPQYGLLAGMADTMKSDDVNSTPDPRLFFNIGAPSSTFICGSQGSGKSHTLSCLLENCLLPSDAGKLPKPLTGLLFHYDTFVSDHGGSPCEAAFLSSNPDIKVRVLCSPANLKTIKASYSYPYSKYEVY